MKKANIDRHVSPPYLSKIRALPDLRNVVNKAAKNLAKFKKHTNFDTIVGTGFSGLLILTPLALKLKVSYLALREVTDTYDVGHVPTKSYVIVDDLIDTGATIRTIYDHVKKLTPSAELVGIYLYVTKYNRRGRFTVGNKRIRTF